MKTGKKNLQSVPDSLTGVKPEAPDGVVPHVHEIYFT